MIRHFFKQPFAAVAQAALVILLTCSFAMITQQFSKAIYQVGFVLLIVSTLVQIVFGNLPPEANFRQSMKLLGIVACIVAGVFAVGIVLAPYLVNLGRR